MNTIWKFELKVTDSQRVTIPTGAVMLSVQVQNGVPVLWALCNPGRPPSTVLIHTHGTGHDVGPSRGQYVGTYQVHGGELVFHVFATTEYGVEE